MVLELHVWGPAFSLPSIDPRCIAAIAFLSQALPREEWYLIASNDPTISPTREFPVLRDGVTIITGYDSIVSYLQRTPNTRHHLDAGLSPLQKADCVAYSSLLVSSVSPLLLLSHYVSSENYVAVTRPALCALLPLPSRYIIPSKIRAAAKSSTEHLGLSTLDVDNYEDQKSNEDVVPGSDQIPVSLRRVRQTVVSMVRQPQHAAQFRLQALLTLAFDPLKELLGDKSHFITDGHITIFDCLALGYLSCALLAEMPQPWLAEALKKKYPTLCTFVHNGIKDCFGGPVRIEDALCLPNTGDISKYYKKTNADLETISLPWKQPSPPTFFPSSALIFDDTIESLPFLDLFRQNKVLASEVDETQNLNAEPSTSNILPTLITVGAAVAAMASYVLYSGLSISSMSNMSSNKSAKRRLDDMGEAGAMLATLNFQPDEVRSMQKDHQLNAKVPIVEVGVEVTNGVAVDKPL